jgi:hypothetical protein
VSGIRDARIGRRARRASIAEVCKSTALVVRLRKWAPTSRGRSLRVCDWWPLTRRGRRAACNLADRPTFAWDETGACPARRSRARGAGAGGRSVVGAGGCRAAERLCRGAAADVLAGGHRARGVARAHRRPAGGRQAGRFRATTMATAAGSPRLARAALRALRARCPTRSPPALRSTAPGAGSCCARSCSRATPTTGTGESA